jgi:hypothetical protein
MSSLGVSDCCPSLDWLGASVGTILGGRMVDISSVTSSIAGNVFLSPGEAPGDIAVG